MVCWESIIGFAGNPKISSVQFYFLKIRFCFNLGGFYLLFILKIRFEKCLDF